MTGFSSTSTVLAQIECKSILHKQNLQVSDQNRQQICPLHLLWKLLLLRLNCIKNKKLGNQTKMQKKHKIIKNFKDPKKIWFQHFWCW